MIKFFAFLVIFFLFVGVGSVCVGQLVSDTSIISMSGKDWSLRVDGVLQSSLDSRNSPYMTSKSVSEKELFLELESFEDCKLGVVQFKVDMQGLISYKQLPLDMELDVKEYEFVNATHAMNGTDVLVYRPIDIVNSFALFDGLGRKQVHISASKLIDVSGAKVWCDSNLEGGLLTVVLPLDWLQSAKFPVVVDPTFGYTSIGETSGSSYDRTRVCRFNLSENGVVNKLYFYSPISQSVRVAIFTDTDPAILLGRTELESCNASEWHIFDTFDNTSALSYDLTNGTYLLAFASSSWGESNFKYDSGTTEHTQGGGTGADIPDSYDLDSFISGIDSIYAEYTTGEPTPTPSPSPSSSPSPSPTSASGTFTLVLGEGDWVLVLEVVMLIACFVSYVWLSKVPIVPLLVGLFAFLVSLYCGLSGLWENSLVIGFFGSFVHVWSFEGKFKECLICGVRVRA